MSSAENKSLPSCSPFFTTDCQWKHLKVPHPHWQPAHWVHLQTSHIHGGSLRLQKETLWNWETDPAKIKGQLFRAASERKKETLMQLWSILTQLFRDHHLHKKPLKKYIPRKPQRSHRAYVQCKFMEKSRHPSHRLLRSTTGSRHSLFWRGTLKSVFLIVCLHSFFSLDCLVKKKKKQTWK